MYLRDWSKASDWFPHYKDSIAGLLGFGGYFGISSVTYNLGVTDQQWTIDVKTKFLGTDASAKVPTNSIGNIKSEPKSDTSDPNGEIKTLEPSGSKKPADAAGADKDGSPGGNVVEETNATAPTDPPASFPKGSIPAGATKLMDTLYTYKGANYALNEDGTKFEKQ